MKKWTVDKKASLRVINENGNTIATTSAGQSGDNLEEEQYNAKVIAATPDTIEALVDLVWLIENGAGEDELIESINMKAKPLLDRLNIKYD